jgi:hypothetical protein
VLHTDGEKITDHGFRYGGSEFGTIIIAVKGVEKWIKKTDDP